MAACVCDMFQNTQAQPLYFPSTFSDWKWECRTFCREGEITEVQLGFIWRTTLSWVTQIWPWSVKRAGWRNMVCVYDISCVAEIWRVSVISTHWIVRPTAANQNLNKLLSISSGRGCLLVETLLRELSSEEHVLCPGVVRWQTAAMLKMAGNWLR